MKILDTNMILRYLLNDNVEMADHVEKLIENNEVLVLPEVVAEVIYVMKRVYNYERTEIADGILEFLSIPNVIPSCGNVLAIGVEAYRDNNLDFVDCILYAYHTVRGHEICTFDKKLNKLIEKT